MSYVLIVTPHILRVIDIPAEDVMVATAVSSGVASIMCGFFARLPVVLAP
eukprot:CAMPEP_0114048258 /NCGR_PEP_ID=MMETSP1339-20121228/41870_1 /TAXON_ID=94617 /ORGANISM="Fibrocapsa japonica" /LENGTH=49 /assembly_acc=CAM_ASM_000762